MEADRRSVTPGLQKAHSTVGSVSIMFVLVALSNFYRDHAERDPDGYYTFTGLALWLRTT